MICKEEVLELSKIEYKLLLYFLENPGQILSKEQILERIWDKDGKFVDENTVSVNIRRLRRKIEADPPESAVDPDGSRTWIYLERRGETIKVWNRS